MSHTTMILSALFTMAMLLIIAPNIFTINRGRVLQNVAIWLAIFLALALFYQGFGPGSPHPLFQQPDAMVGMHAPAQTATDKGDWSKDDSDKNDGTQGFTPPKE